MFLHQVLNRNNESRFYWYKQGLKYTLFLKVECKMKRNTTRFTVNKMDVVYGLRKFFYCCHDFKLFFQ